MTFAYILTKKKQKKKTKKKKKNNNKQTNKTNQNKTKKDKKRIDFFPALYMYVSTKTYVVNTFFRSARRCACNAYPQHM